MRNMPKIADLARTLVHASAAMNLQGDQVHDLVQACTDLTVQLVSLLNVEC